MEFTFERPSSPVHSIKKGRPESNHTKPEIERAHWPFGIDKFHKE
jgi:hypothetical protein